jgi:hypothetical protein
MSVLKAGRCGSCSQVDRWTRSVALIAAFGWLAIAAPAGAVTFRAPMNTAVGTNPYSVAVGDFNRDGRHDLATANFGSLNVSVLLSGPGGFGAATNISTPSPVSVAVGDFNLDGRPDLAAANPNFNDVSVLLGDGIGGFAAPANVTVGGAPRAVAVGDFNGDGRPDLATVNQLGNTASVLLGDGMGGFSAPASSATGTTPFAIAVGDLNGDGRPDLATANPNSNNVSVLLGNGSGGLGAATNVAVGGTAPRGVAIADLNGDGRPDLVTANGNSASASVLLGDGSGGFGAPTSFPAAGGPNSVAVSDFDGDGLPDVVTANVMANNVSVLMGDGSGGLGAPKNFAVGTTPSHVAVDDLNADGRPDLVTANTNSSNVSVLLNTTEGIAPAVSITTPVDGATYARGQSVSAGYACADEEGGSGIASCVGTVADGQPVDTTTLGPKTFSVTATDYAGNTTTRTAGYEVVDVTAPTINAVSPGASTAYEQGATILADYSCADEPGGSGLASCTGTVPSGQPIDTSGGAHLFTISAADSAGNLASTTINYTARDRTAPQISISSPTGSYSLLSAILNPPRARFACADNAGGSGLASCTATVDGRPVANGAALAPGLGPHAFTVTATDAAHNTRTQTTTYTITLL